VKRVTQEGLEDALVEVSLHLDLGIMMLNR